MCYLDLGLGHAKCVRQLGSLGARQVLGLLERLLQREDLLAAERGPCVFLLALLVCRRGHCNTGGAWSVTQRQLSARHAGLLDACAFPANNLTFPF